MQINDLAAKLLSLGLSDKQSKVYVAALFLGASPVQKIAEQAGINRATAYVILDELAELGLVSQSTEGKKTVFVADGPDGLERWIERQELSLKGKRQVLKEIQTDLDQTARTVSPSAPVVRFFKGSEGTANVHGYLRRKARPKSTIYAMTNVDELQKVLPNVLSKNPPARLKKKISSKLLYSYKRGELESSDKLMRQTYKLDTPIAADVNLYEEGVSIGTYDQADPVEILIESPDVARALRQLFELAWDNLPQEK